MGRRLFYFTIVTVIIALGILSRKIDGIPFFIGDLLYAMMVYAAARMLFPKIKAAVWSLLACFAIEFSQLLQFEWLVSMRENTLARYVLGQGFLWTDLVAYTAGILVAFVSDRLYNKKTGKDISGL